MEKHELWKDSEITKYILLFVSIIIIIVMGTNLVVNKYSFSANTIILFFLSIGLGLYLLTQKPLVFLIPLILGFLYGYTSLKFIVNQYISYLPYFSYTMIFIFFLYASYFWFKVEVLRITNEGIILSNITPHSIETLRFSGSSKLIKWHEIKEIYIDEKAKLQATVYNPYELLKISTTNSVYDTILFDKKSS